MEGKAGDDPTSDAENAPVVPRATKGPPKMAPPKSAPPPADDKKDGGEGTVDVAKKPKKKAPPPPSGAPPKSAAAALRAKTNGSPPSSPQPQVNASVQKIRSAALQDAKDDTDKPKPKKKPPPPASAPPPSDAKDGDAKASVVEATPDAKPEAKPKPKKKPPPPATMAPPTDAKDSDAAVEVERPKKKPAKKPPAQHVDVLGEEPVEAVAPKATPVPKPAPAVAPKRKSIAELLNEGAETPVFRKNTAALVEELVPKNQDVFTPMAMPTTGKAAPMSQLSHRRDLQDEETLTVTRQVKKVVEAKPAQPALDASLDDDIEEIPFLEAADAKAAADDDAKDPEIIMEKAAPRSTPAVVEPDDEEAKVDNNSAPLPKSKTALADALYSEMKQLETMGKEDIDRREIKEAKEDEATEPPEAKPKKNRKSKPPKTAEEPKRTFEYFNPKRVPYVPNHLLDFVTRPLEAGRGHILKCFIERNRIGQNRLSPVYTLLIEVNSSSGRPILYCRQKATSQFSSHFIFSLNKEDLFLSRAMRSKQFVGKLRSDTRKMEYALFDQGDNPEDIDSDCEIDDEIRQHIRAQLCIIRFHNLKKEHPRKMEVIIPAINESGTGYLDWRPITRDQAMETLFNEISQKGGENVIEHDKFICMHKRETQYDPLSSCIVDFRSRATCVSVKNFQMVHSQPLDQVRHRDTYIQLHPSYHYDDEGTVSVPQEHVLLQMGRVGQHCFNMDFQYPLSMLQAFAICIARFDSKQR
ncbi:tubby-like protein [Achlya hypogyna]|uniref:Tubby-like protein n=1 Tax=Achlya hypogyna TaxID=1202772 RepID=A0A1V9ZAC5_ACHHY|nr:tubby-like protein [Achlya hypogyna]